MGNKNVTSALRARAVAQASLEPAATARSEEAQERVPYAEVMFYLRTNKTAGGVRTNNSLELTPVVSPRRAFSWHAGCGAAVKCIVPAATSYFMITGPVQLNSIR